MCIYEHIPCACRCPWRPEEDAIFPRAGVTGSCELPTGFWEQGSGPLQEQCVFFTVSHLFGSFLNWSSTLVYEEEKGGERDEGEKKGEDVEEEGS